MNSKILKLNAPYNIIYAGGRIGRHIATMTVWDDSEYGIFEAPGITDAIHMSAKYLLKHIIHAVSMKDSAVLNVFQRLAITICFGNVKGLLSG